MGTIALIPARGGSKRLPRKNILDLGGKPLLSYAIHSALATNLFDHVYVSTEDLEVAGIALAAGAEILNRPSRLALDHSTVVDVCLDVLASRLDVDLLCCIYATAVFLTPNSILQGYDLLHASPAADGVMGVSEYEHSPVQALTLSEQGFLSYMWPEWQGVQSQHYPRLLVSNGTFYWIKSSALLSEKSFYCKRLRGFIVPQDEVSDIDTFADLEHARKRFVSE
jgi:pseudaminic acid cytidylyltransferase